MYKIAQTQLHGANLVVSDVVAQLVAPLEAPLGCPRRSTVSPDSLERLVRPIRNRQKLLSSFLSRCPSDCSRLMADTNAMSYNETVTSTALHDCGNNAYPREEIVSWDTTLLQLSEWQELCCRKHGKKATSHNVRFHVAFYLSLVKPVLQRRENKLTHYLLFVRKYCICSYNAIVTELYRVYCTKAYSIVLDHIFCCPEQHPLS